MESSTRALLVVVTAGPLGPVVRWPNTVDARLAVSPTEASTGARSTIALTPDVAIYRPAAVAFAAGVSFRLSRMDALSWEAVGIVLSTKVSGVVQVIWNPPSPN